LPSIFDCINQRADAIKAQRWLDYQPLTRRQLKDETRVEAETNTEMVTLDVGVLGQFVVLKRPTETEALRGDPHRDKTVERRPTIERRWCIYCKQRHLRSAFVRSPRYLHNLSYACKTSLLEAKQRPWKYVPGCLTPNVQ